MEEAVAEENCKLALRAVKGNLRSEPGEAERDKRGKRGREKEVGNPTVQDRFITVFLTEGTRLFPAPLREQFYGWLRGRRTTRRAARGAARSAGKKEGVDEVNIFCGFPFPTFLPTSLTRHSDGWIGGVIGENRGWNGLGGIGRGGGWWRG